MKRMLRNPWVMQCAALLGAWLLRAWCSTLLRRVRFADPEANPLLKPDDDDAVIYVMWHDSLLIPVCHWGRRHAAALVSHHADGDLISRITCHCGANSIRGSSSRGGMKAMREMIRASKRFDLWIACDGPRGPRRELKIGVLRLAAWTGKPLVLAAFGHDRPWRFRSWDRFALPRPFTKSYSLFSEPIHVPPGLTAGQFEFFRRDLEIRLNQLADEADALAEGRAIPSPSDERKAAA